MKLKEKFEECICNAKWHTSNAVNRGINWCKNNPDIATVLGITLIGATGGLVKAAIKNHGSVTASEQRRIARTYYDTRTGIHWKLKRDATNEDRKAVHDAFMAGEDTYDVLKKRHLI